MLRTRACVRAAAISLLVGVAGLSSVSCGEGNPGIDPPDASFSFPTGVMLDPRVAADSGEPARWLFVINANSDRRFNGGSLVAVDLDAFWAAVEDTGALLDPTDTLDPFSGPLCRRIANFPQAVECVEERFVVEESTVRFGNFPGPAAAWVRDVDGATATSLLIPVRGDPSVTYVDLIDRGGVPEFECDQGAGRRCGDDFRLRFLRNDSDEPRLSREPFRVLVSPDPALPLAYVSHQGDPDLTLINLEGVSDDSTDRPAIVHQANILGINGAPFNIQGGFGLAQRPCGPENMPNATVQCSRPLVYSAMRWATEIRTFTAITHVPPACVDDGDGEAGDDGDAEECEPEDLEPQAEPLRNFPAGGLSTAEVPLTSSRPLLADVGFSRDGNQLYVVQTNPGGLLRIDTSIGDDGEVLDDPAGQVEVCSQPTSLAIYDDGQVEYGVVTCYRSGEVFIVDLAKLTVVGLSRAGIGPDAIAVDLAREVLYVTNTLDATVSVIDMSPESPSRFTQIARIGIQEPYVQ